MKVILGLLGLILCLAALVGMFLSLISAITLGGYLLARVVLRILGLHIGSSLQVRNELRLVVGFGILIFVTLVSTLLGALTNSWLGLD
jgi:hypothetical protein